MYYNNCRVQQTLYLCIQLQLYVYVYRTVLIEYTAFACTVSRVVVLVVVTRHGVPVEGGGLKARQQAPSTQSLSTSRPARCGSSAPLPRAIR